MSISEVEIFGPALDEARRLVDQHLDQYSSLDEDCPEKLAEAIRYSLLSPGKRLRPMLVLAANRLCGGSIESAMPAACAVEMIHTYSLIHDDLPAMDDDDMRRGKPSCHIAFDEPTAILAGDALIPLAFEVISKNTESSQIALRCVQELSVAIGACQLVGGQFDDLRFENLSVDIDVLERIHRRKTGALFVCSLRMGALCANANESQLHALTEYGKNLGLAFQVTDDLLDLCGEEAKIGKRVGKDSELGKRTYPGIIGIDASRDLARELVELAINSLNSFGEQGEDLRRFARFVVDRNY